MSYIDMIKERARLDKKTIVLPESNDKRTLLAAARIVEEGIADIIMIGDEEKIMDGAGWLEVDLSKVKVVNPKTTPKLDDYVNLLYETRKAKGMTPEKAREILLNDYLTFGIVMSSAYIRTKPWLPWMPKHWRTTVQIVMECGIRCILRRGVPAR